MIQELSTTLAELIDSSRSAVAMVSAPGAAPRSAVALDAGAYLTPAYEAEVGEHVTIVRADAAEEAVEGRVVRFWPGVNLALLAATTAGRDESAAPPEALGTALRTVKALASRRADDPGIRVGSVTVTVAFPSAEGVEARMGIVRCMGSDGSYFQTDGAAFPGFAGAPVFDAAGSLLGMTLPGRGGNDSVVLPVDQIAAILEGGASGVGGGTRRGVLGVTTEAIPLPDDGEMGSAAVILTVQSDSAAAAAGLRYGDIVTHIDEEAIDGPHSLAHRLLGRATGEEITLRIIRAGEPVVVPATLGEASADRGGEAELQSGGHRARRPWRRWSTMHMMG